MTIVTTEIRSGPYTAASDTTFDVDFYSAGDDEIEVTLDGLVLDPVLYTFDRNPDGTGQVITQSPVTGEVLIYSVPNFEQRVEFLRHGAFYPDQLNNPLDRMAARDLYLKGATDAAIKTTPGTILDPFTPTPGGYLAFDALGQPISAQGTGTDPSLRADLASPTGASLILSSTGESVDQVALRPRRLSFNSFKTRAYDRPTAIVMAQDVTFMKGWAKNAGTTGGAGKPVYWVSWSSDDPNTPGTLRYAIAQATAGGGGQILFNPYLEIDIILQSRIDIPSNVTIAAPGRNVRIRSKSNVVCFQIANANNIIIKFLDISQLIDTTGINNKLNPGDPGYDAQQGGPANQADAITIVPTNADKIWIDQCSFQHISDGCIDIATSTLHVGNPACRASISRCSFRNQYKTMLCGTTSTTTGDVDYTAARSVYVSYYNNWYDHTAERHPRVSGLGYADSVNNIFDLAAVQADDGVASGGYGIASLYGGWVRTRGDLFRTLDGVATQAVQTADGTSPAGVPQSATINQNSVAEGSLVIQTFNTGTPTALPGVNYDLVADTVPAAGPLREAWRNAICAAAGARIESMPGGLWYYSSVSTAALNGVTVRAAPDHGLVGRYLLSDNQQELVPSPEALQGVTQTIWKRGGTKTLASDAITIDQSATEFGVSPETGTADNIVTINGGVEDQIISLRPASASHVLTVLTTGNIFLGSRGKSLVLTGSKDHIVLRYESAIGWMVIAAPDQAGVYTPTITAVTNVASSASPTGMWSRNGDIVTVSGSVSITPTAAASADTAFTVSLPIASDLTGVGDLCGTSNDDDAVTQVAGTVKPNTATDTAQVRFKASTTSARTHYFIFQYQVK